MMEAQTYDNVLTFNCDSHTASLLTHYHKIHYWYISKWLHI